MVFHWFGCLGGFCWLVVFFFPQSIFLGASGESTAWCDGGRDLVVSLVRYCGVEVVGVRLGGFLGIFGGEFLRWGWQGFWGFSW